MDGLALLAEARAVGLSVVAEGDRLVIRGPRSASDIASCLLAAKPAVIAAIAHQHADHHQRDHGIWWDDRVPDESAPVLHLPPRQCIAPRACARIGVCERHAIGRPCLVDGSAS